MKEKEKITLTRKEFKAKMRTVLNGWAEESLGDNIALETAMAHIHADIYERIEKELFGDTEAKDTKETAGENTERDALEELEEIGILPKGMIDAIKRARGKGGNIHVEVIGVKKK